MTNFAFLQAEWPDLYEAAFSLRRARAIDGSRVCRTMPITGDPRAAMVTVCSNEPDTTATCLPHLVAHRVRCHGPVAHRLLAALTGQEASQTLSGFQRLSVRLEIGQERLPG